MTSNPNRVWWLAETKTSTGIVHFIFADSIDEVRELLSDVDEKYLVLFVFGQCSKVCRSAVLCFRQGKCGCD